jgi:hypothetical protein
MVDRQAMEALPPQALQLLTELDRQVVAHLLVLVAAVEHMYRLVEQVLLTQELVAVVEQLVMLRVLFMAVMVEGAGVTVCRWLHLHQPLIRMV